MRGYLILGKKVIFSIVLYNKCISNCVTLNRLHRWEGKSENIFIFDNSDNAEILENNNELSSGWNYYTKNKNLGLSKAYNEVINIVNERDINADYIVWLDDDTSITEEWYQLLMKSLNKTKSAKIIVPKIYCEGKYYSPNEANILKNKQILNENYFSNSYIFKKFNAINSCLCLSMDIFETYRYDENLFIDQVDQHFFDYIREFDYSYEVLDTVVEQNFSQISQLDSNYIKRFSLRVRDLKIYSNLKEKKWDKIGTKIKIIFLGIKYTIKMKDTRFFKASIKSLKKD